MLTGNNLTGVYIRIGAVKAPVPSAMCALQACHALVNKACHYMREMVMPGGCLAHIWLMSS